MEWSSEIFVWLLTMAIIPGSAFLINVAIRFGKDIPLSSGSDLILLLIIYTACVIGDPTILKGLASPETSEKIVSIHLDFLIASGLAWILSAIFIEKKLNYYYQSSSIGVDDDAKSNVIDDAKFPLTSWLLTWCLSLAITIVYILVI